MEKGTQNVKFVFLYVIDFAAMILFAEAGDE